MGYRDESEALRARVASLEGQLADAHATIARLTGEGPNLADGNVTEKQGVLGTARRVVCDRVLDFEIQDAAFERIAKAVRPRLTTGRFPAQVAQVGRTLQAPGFFLESRDGRTRVRMESDFDAAAAAAVTLTGLGSGFLAMCAFAIAHDGWFRGMSEAHLLWIWPLVALALFPLVRARMARTARKKETELRATFETVLEIARGAATPSSGREAVRIEVAGPERVAPADVARERAAMNEAEAEVAPAADAAVARATRG